MSTIPTSLLVLQNGNQTGPFPAETVAEMLRLGTFNPADFAWGEGMAEWRPLSELFPAPQAAKPATSAKYSTADSLIINRALASAARAADTEDLSFFQYVKGSFTYPFKGDGPIILVTGTIFFTILRTLTNYSMTIGLVSFGVLFVRAFATGYFAAMVMSVVQATANGERGLPSWPDADGWKDYFFKWIGLYIVCLGPGMVMLIFGAATEDPQKMLLGGALYGLGVAYLPMALLAIALSDSFAGINPMVVFPWIFSTFGQYIVVAIMSAIAIGIPTLIEYVIKAHSKEFSFGSIIGLSFASSVGSLWSWFVVARMLGGLYRVNRDKLQV